MADGAFVNPPQIGFVSQFAVECRQPLRRLKRCNRIRHPSPRSNGLALNARGLCKGGDVSAVVDVPAALCQ